MAANSSIEWTDATWNPVLGCSRVSPGCKNCYAIIVARSWRARRKKMTNSLVKGITLEGFAAIEYAEEHGLSLSKYNDPTEDSREGLTPDEARAVAREDSRLIYLSVSVHENQDGLARETRNQISCIELPGGAHALVRSSQPAHSQTSGIIYMTTAESTRGFAI